MERLHWQPAPNATAIWGYDFADQGNKFVLLDNIGHLTIFHYHGHLPNGGAAFELVAKLPLIEAHLAGLPTGARFLLAISAADERVYVTDPITKQLITVDVRDAKVISRKQLDFTPHQITWLGIAEPEDHGDGDGVPSALCGDVVGDLVLSPGAGLSVDTAACRTTTTTWSPDSILPAVVAAAVGTFTGPPTSLLRLMGVGATSRPFLASAFSRFNNDFEVVSNAQSVVQGPFSWHFLKGGPYNAVVAPLGSWRWTWSF